MAHIHEKIDFTASAFIVFENKVLLQKHKKLGKWLQPGGHIELDEGPIEAVLREAKEETGLDIELVGLTPATFETESGARELMVPRHLNRHYFGPTRDHEHIDMVYFARSNSGVVRPAAGESEARWFTQAAISDPQLDTFAHVRQYALEALKELSS